MVQVGAPTIEDASEVEEDDEAQAAVDAEKAADMKELDDCFTKIEEFSGKWVNMEICFWIDKWIDYSTN